MKAYFITITSLFLMTLIGTICCTVFYCQGRELIASISAGVDAFSIMSLLLVNHLYISRQIKKDLKEQEEALNDIKKDLQIYNRTH